MHAFLVFGTCVGLKSNPELVGGFNHLEKY
jgi:hypothetical protein